MSENIQSISQGTYTIGQTSATNFVAGAGIKIDEPSAGTVRIGNDETVLYSGNAELNSTINLSESVINFDRIRLYWIGENKSTSKIDLVNEVSIQGDYKRLCIDSLIQRYDNGKWNYGGFELSASDSSVSSYKMIHNYRYNLTTAGIIDIDNDKSNFAYIHKVIGINRISGSNA